MQIHLLDYRSPNVLVRRFAGQKLELCMLGLVATTSYILGRRFHVQTVPEGPSQDC